MLFVTEAVTDRQTNKNVIDLAFIFFLIIFITIPYLNQRHVLDQQRLLKLNKVKSHKKDN